jgi:hypothetical protein
LKEIALSAEESGADIYRPTMAFAGAMIFAGGSTLIVIVGLNIMILINRAQKDGRKIRGMGKVGDVGYGKEDFESETGTNYAMVEHAYWAFRDLMD